MSLTQGRWQSQKSQWTEDCQKNWKDKSDFYTNHLRKVAVLEPSEAPDLTKVIVGSGIIKCTKLLSLQMQAAEETQKFVNPL